MCGEIFKYLISYKRYNIRYSPPSVFKQHNVFWVIPASFSSVPVLGTSVENNAPSVNTLWGWQNGPFVSLSRATENIKLLDESHKESWIWFGSCHLGPETVSQVWTHSPAQIYAIIKGTTT